jgi:hypothetical protein
VWAELESACQKSGTYTLSSNFNMDSYTKEIHFGGKQLVIWGKNATLDAAKKGRFFSSTAGPNDDDDHSTTTTSLELHDLVLQNGMASMVCCAGVNAGNACSSDNDCPGSGSGLGCQCGRGKSGSLGGAIFMRAGES